MDTQSLFQLPVLESPTSDKQVGVFICTSPAPQVYLLTFISPPDNRLTTSFCQTFLLALDIIEHKAGPSGVVITTSGIPKFYSNGLDLEHVNRTPGFWSDSLYALFKRLITYPMPTIAVVNGHAFAGGFMTAMYHDYRVFNPSRGFLCVNELDFGVPLQAPMSSIFRQKLASPAVYRAMVLEAKRFNGKEALEGGVVDVLGGLPEALQLVEERKLVGRGKSGIYAVMKAEMYRETLGYIEDWEGEHKRNKEWVTTVEGKRKSAMESRVKEWKRNTQSKL